MEVLCKQLNMFFIVFILFSSVKSSCNSCSQCELQRNITVSFHTTKIISSLFSYGSHVAPIDKMNALQCIDLRRIKGWAGAALSLTHANYGLCVKAHCGLICYFYSQAEQWTSVMKETLVSIQSIIRQKRASHIECRYSVKRLNGIIIKGHKLQKRNACATFNLDVLDH